MFIRPTIKDRINAVKPKVTPSICGIVLITPKLKPEYDATILFGPGVKAVTNQKRQIEIISGCIIYAIGNPFSAL